MTQDTPRRLRDIITVAAVLSLIVVNVLAWKRGVVADQQLQWTQQIHQQWTVFRAQQSQLSNSRDALSHLAYSYDIHGMQNSLRSAVETAKPTSVLVLRTGENSRDSTSFFLYSPDHSQTMVIDTSVADNVSTDANPLGDPVKDSIEIPLQAGKFYQLDVGVTGRDTARVSLDGKDVFSQAWDGFETFTTSSSATRLPLGLVQANTLYTLHDPLKQQISTGRWARLSHKQHRFFKGYERRSVKIVIYLRGAGDVFVPFPQCWDVKEQFVLKWDQDKLLHRVLP